MPDIGLARRCQWWLLASLFHSLTTIWMIFKEYLIFLKEQKQPGYVEMDNLRHASLFVRSLGPFFFLIVSIVLLASLVRHYPIAQDVVMIWFIISYGCIGYLSILLTDLIYFDVTVALEVMLIPVTICMHALRFASQGPLIQLEVVPLIFSLLGVLPGALCLIPLGGEKFLEHLLKRLALNIATLVGAAFRLLDAIVICCHTTREAVNYFRSRLHECFQ